MVIPITFSLETITLLFNIIFFPTITDFLGIVCRDLAVEKMPSYLNDIFSVYVPFPLFVDPIVVLSCLLPSSQYSKLTLSSSTFLSPYVSIDFSRVVSPTSFIFVNVTTRPYQLSHFLLKIPMSFNILIKNESSSLSNSVSVQESCGS